MSERITFGELANKLNIFLKDHPDYSNYSVSVAAECGWSGASIANPLVVLANKDMESIYLHSDDDMSINGYKDCGYESYYMDTFK